MAKKPVDKNKLEFASHPPSWITPFDYINLKRDERKVIDFFVVRTPCKAISAHEVLLTSYGWNSDIPERDGYLYKRLMDVAGLSEGENFFVGSRREDMKQVFQNASMDELFFERCSENRIAYLENGNRVLSLFKAIRNSFAHSRFIVSSIEDTRFFVMENGLATGSSFEVKARMLLKVSTLTKWIHAITTEASIASELEQHEQEKARIAHEALMTAALKAIQNGLIGRVEDLRTECGMTKKQANAAIDDLKSSFGVEYSRQLKRWVAPTQLKNDGSRTVTHTLTE